MAAKNILFNSSPFFNFHPMRRSTRNVVRCVCTSAESEGQMIECEDCGVWQHSACVVSAVPEFYWCELCRPIDHPSLTLSQVTETTEGAETGTSGTSGSVPSGPQKKRRIRPIHPTTAHNAHVQLDHGKTYFETLEDVENSDGEVKDIEYTPSSTPKSVSKETSSKKRSVNGNRKSLNGSKKESEESEENPKLNARRSTIATREAEQFEYLQKVMMETENDLLDGKSNVIEEKEHQVKAHNVEGNGHDMGMKNIEEKDQDVEVNTKSFQDNDEKPIVKVEKSAKKPRVKANSSPGSAEKTKDVNAKSNASSAEKPKSNQKRSTMASREAEQFEFLQAIIQDSEQNAKDITTEEQHHYPVAKAKSNLGSAAKPKGNLKRSTMASREAEQFQHALEESEHNEKQIKAKNSKSNNRNNSNLRVKTPKKIAKAAHAKKAQTNVKTKNQQSSAEKPKVNARRSTIASREAEQFEYLQVAIEESSQAAKDNGGFKEDAPIDVWNIQNAVEKGESDTDIPKTPKNRAIISSDQHSSQNKRARPADVNGSVEKESLKDVIDVGAPQNMEMIQSLDEKEAVIHDQVLLEAAVSTVEELNNEVTDSIEDLGMTHQNNVAAQDHSDSSQSKAAVNTAESETKNEENLQARTPALNQRDVEKLLICTTELPIATTNAIIESTTAVGNEGSDQTIIENKTPVEDNQERKQTEESAHVNESIRINVVDNASNVSVQGSLIAKHEVFEDRTSSIDNGNFEGVINSAATFDSKIMGVGSDNKKNTESVQISQAESLDPNVEMSVDEVLNLF